jgi:PAS domain S-box-containing protein
MSENDHHSEQQPLKKVRYVPWLFASLILILLVVKISDWRVQVVKNRLHEQYLLEASDFVNALDIKFFNSVNYHDSLLSKSLLNRYIDQLNSYLIINPHLQIFGLRISDEQAVVSITSTTANSVYKINEPFIDVGNLLHQALSSSKTIISEPVSKPHGEVICVYVPFMNPQIGEISFVIGIDFPTEEYNRLLSKAKMNSLYSSITIILLILTTIFLVIWRDKQVLSRRKRLRHIETIAVIIIGIPVVLVGLFLSYEYAEKEKNSVFLNASSQHTSDLRSSFWKIRSGLEVFANFYSNSEFVDSVEFVSFATQLMDNSPVHSFLWFDNSELSLVKKSEDLSKQFILSDNKSFEPSYIHNPSDQVPLDEILSKSRVKIREIAAASLQNGLTNATETIIIGAKENAESYILVMIAAFSDIKSKTKNPDKTRQAGFIAAVFNPQQMFNSSFNKNDRIAEQINIGFIEMDSKSNPDWLASFPADHWQLHQEENIAEHLRKYKHQNIIPLFLFGRVYGIVTHTTKEFEKEFGKLRGILIGISGMVFTLLLAVMIMIWRNRWYRMEKLVDQRTAELRRGISVLTHLKTIGDELQEIQSVENILSKVNLILSAALDKNHAHRISIHYKNENYGHPSLGNKKENAFEIPLLLLGRKVGSIVAETINNNELSKQDIQLIEQVALMLNRWLEHQAVSESLKESEEKFRSLIESAFDSIYILEGKHFTYVNKAFVDLVGYSKEELTDPDFDLELLLTEKSRELVKSRMHARNNNLEIEPRYEFQQCTKSGEIKDVEVSTVSISHGGQRKVMGILRDITERKKIEKALIESEERLQQQNEELQALNEELVVSNSQIKDMNQDLIAAREKAEASDNLKTAFLNNISHEVRTPLNGILGATVVMAEPDISDEVKAEMAFIVEQSSQRLIRTITQYMDISLLNSGNMPVILNDVNLIPFLNKLLDGFRIECKRKKLDFISVISPESNELIVHSDKSLIEKVLYHLLENAVKFTKEGSVGFRLQVRKDALVFEISDTGIGIEKEFHANVFGYFSQEDSSNLRQHDGSGLGLAICKKICDLIGAKIWFQSEKGSGSKFFVELSLKTEIGQEKVAIDSGREKTENHSPLILIAEDEESNFIVLSMLLQKKLNARILRAVTGREAVDLCYANPDVQLVLMDIKMPVMDGFEATRWIKTEKPTLPVIAITAYGLSGDEYKSLNAGCDDYIAKPVNTRDLIEKVKTYLRI